MLRFVILALALLVPVSVAAAVEKKTITLVADEWCPYNCEKDAEQEGFMVEIARQAFEKHGYAVEYTTMPWDKAIEETRAGRFTAIIGASRSDAPDFIFPRIEQGWMSNQFFVRKGNKWRYLGKDSLSEVTLAVSSGYTYGRVIDNYIRLHMNNPKRLAVASGAHVLANNVVKLLASDVDVVLEDRNVMAYYLWKNNLAGKVIEAGRIPISDSNNLHIAISPAEKSAKRLARILAEETEALRESGELAEILKRYSIPDWRHATPDP